MSEKPFSIVLPVKLHDIELDLERLVEINLASLDKFFDKNHLANLLLIASASDLKRISNFSGETPLFDRTKFIDELDLCPAFRSEAGSGWFRQQIIKIAASNIASTKYLISYDDDIVMTRQASLNDFVIEKRLIMSHIPIEVHPQFFKSSCAVLQYDERNYSSGEVVMNVTPEILITDALLGLQHEIESIWGVSDFGAWLLKLSGGSPELPSKNLMSRIYRRAFKRRIARREQSIAKLRAKCGNWTEYSLYWTYLKKKGLTHYYHDYSRDHLAPQLGDKGVWTNEQAEDLDMDQWITETFQDTDRYYFAVFSAKITNVNRRLLYDRIKQRLAEPGSRVE